MKANFDSINKETPEEEKEREKKQKEEEQISRKRVSDVDNAFGFKES